MFRSYEIIFREYVFTLLKSLDYLKFKNFFKIENTEFKIPMVNSGVLAAIHVLRMRCDPCGAMLMFLLLSIFETLF